MTADEIRGKTLLLVRHAKSSWKDASLADHDRPLNKRGRRDAPEMACRLAGGPCRPQRIVTSTACRAATTAEILAAGLGLDTDVIEPEASLYGAGAIAILRVVRALDDRLDTVMLVGHNPGMTHLVNALVAVAIENVPTCGVAVLRIEATSWSAVDARAATLLDFDFPKKGQ